MAGPSPPSGAVWIAVGSNLGDRAESIERALARLDGHPEVRVTTRSSLRETDPVGGPPGQGRYLNGVARLETGLDPAALLRLLLETEAAGGRVRSAPNAPREIDLDILLYDDLVISSPELDVPHPRMLERAFVLEPLAECAPGLVHPVTGKTMEEHWSGLRTGEVTG